MTRIYEDLLAILEYVEHHSALPEGITEDNVRYIKSVVSAAKGAI